MSTGEAMTNSHNEMPNETITGIWFHDREILDEIEVKMNQLLEKTFCSRQTFTYIGKLFKYIEEQERVTSLCLIISCTNAEYLIKEIKHNNEYCQFIYEFEDRPIHLSGQDRIYTDVDKLFKKISMDMKPNSIHQSSLPIPECYRNDITPSVSFERPSPPFAIYHSTIKQNSICHINQDSGKFLFFQTMTDIIVEMRHGPEALDEMICECRDIYYDNISILSEIERFKKTYREAKSIYHYTKSSFAFKVLNRSFRSEDVERVYRCRKYATDLHRQLREHYDLQRSSQRIETVFRGKKLPLAIIQQLIDWQGCLISMNGFVSVTRAIKVAIAFSGECGTRDYFGSVVYEMHINEDIMCPVADIKHISQFRHEEEVLLSLGSVWRIGSVKNDGTFWRVVLFSCSKTDLQLRELKSCLIHGSTLLSLGDILRKQGDLVKAERFYRRMLKDGSLSKKLKGSLYHALGMTYLEQNQVQNAVRYLGMALPLIESETNENTLFPSSSPHISDGRLSRIEILNNIGLMYQNAQEYDQAVKWYQKALNEPDGVMTLLHKFETHYNLGRLYISQGLYEKAGVDFKKAVQLSNGRSLSEKHKNALSTIQKYLVRRDVERRH